MLLKSFSPLTLFLLITACAMTQTPVNVADSQQPELTAKDNQTISVPAGTTRMSANSVPGSLSGGDARPTETPSTKVQVHALALSDIPTMAQAIRKNPALRKNYLGQTLQGSAKFVKTAKGNPNAVVADVRVNGLGEVSIWCRNVVGTSNYAPPGRVVSFSGQLSGAVYTSEDFSHDVSLKDCRFHE